MAMAKQIVKYKMIDFPRIETPVKVEEHKVVENSTLPENKDEKTVPNNNKKKKKEKNMANDKVNVAEEIASRLNDSNVKRVKNDKGLIERTESSKIILTEDNRQVLND